MRTGETIMDKFAGAMLGTFVGDALGMPVEGRSMEWIRRHCGIVREMLPARLGPGTYTDDTEMMLGVAESLAACRGFDGAHMAQAFLSNFDRRRGYGEGTTRALEAIASGVSWEESGMKVFDGGSFGNGSAMRVAPVGLFYYDDGEELKKIAAASSRITHAHPLGIRGAQLQARAVALAVSVPPEGDVGASVFLDELGRFMRGERDVYVKRLDEIGKLLESGAGEETVLAALGSDSRATHSVPAAIYSFLRHPDSFEEAVVHAVSLGGDTDTVGAMTGAIAGARHGRGGLPRRWLDALENGEKGRDYVEHLAMRLYRLKKSAN
jgi:poly(ADP-ribose) glycohydrolase ARH3